MVMIKPIVSEKYFLLVFLPEKGEVNIAFRMSFEVCQKGVGRGENLCQTVVDLPVVEQKPDIVVVGIDFLV